MEGSFIGSLTGIITVKEGLNSDMADYIYTRAKLDNVKLEDNMEVVIFNISGTTSYQVYFIDENTTIEDIKSKLEKINVIMNYDSEEILKQYFSENKKNKL